MDIRDLESSERILPGRWVGECSSQEWAGLRRSRETECRGSVEGWRRAEKVNTQSFFTVVTSEIPHEQLIVDCV